MKAFFDFLIYGYLIPKEYSIVKNIFYTFIGYFIFLFTYIFILAILAYFFEFNTSKTPTVAVARLGQASIYIKILLVCLIYPILEEVAFRLPLKVNQVNLIIGLSFFCLFASAIFRDLINWNNYKYIIHIIVLISSAFFIYSKYNSIESIITNNYFLYIHLLSFFFCIFHYDSYNLKESPVTAIIALISALFFSYYLAFIRLKFGLGYSILIHCFHNTLLSIPYIIKILIK